MGVKSLSNQFLPVPSIGNPYTYLDTLKDFHPDIWDAAVALVNSFSASISSDAISRR